MEYNEKMYGLGSKRSIIREIFEYSKARAKEIGADAYAKDAAEAADKAVELLA